MQGFWKDSRPIAFFGCPRGHRVNKETPCFLKARGYYPVGFSPSKPIASRIDAAKDRDGPDDDIGSSHTLKLLVVSIVLDRNVLLFSKSLRRSLQSCEPESGAPSPASCPWLANPDRVLPAHCRSDWPAWPRL